MSPDQINAQHPEPVYRCRVCRASAGLHWFAGTSCPVCGNPDCEDQVALEYAQALEADNRHPYDGYC